MMTNALIGALVLTRKIGEDIVVQLDSGEEVRIRLKQLRRNQARISVSAPRRLRILRAELLEDAGEEPVAA